MAKFFYITRLVWVAGMGLGHFSGCHQLPERSFSIRGYQFPICARCTGTLVGELAVLIAYFGFGLLLPPAAAFGCAMVMLFDWAAQQLGRYEGSNPGRFFTGILGGLGCWTMLIHIGRAIAGLF